MKIRKIVSLLLVISLLVSFNITANAAYENTYKNTGNQAADIVGVARTQVGYAEGSNNYTKYGVWYGYSNVAWCGVFIAWCANQAGISESIVPGYGACESLKSWFSGKGLWKSAPYYGGTYKPQPGDIVFYDWNNNGSPDHVGLVETVSGNQINTIEGNYSDKVSRRTGVLITSNQVLGFGVPAYKTVELTTLGPGEYKVKADPYLNMRQLPNSTAEIIGTIPNGATISVATVSNGWAKATYNGLTGFVSTSYIVLVSAALQSISVTTLPTKTTYSIGESLSTSGMVVKGTYSDGTVKTLTSYTVSGFSSDTEGTKTVKVSSGGKSTTFNVVVTKSYSTGTYKVTATELNLRKGAGTTYDVYVAIPKDTVVTVTKVSGNWGQVTYKTYTGWVSMTYLEEVIVDVSDASITLSATKLEMYDTQTAVLTAKTNPSAQSVTWSSSVPNVASVSNGLVTAIKEGTTTITAKFTYGGKTLSASCKVTVNARNVKLISIKTQPTKTNYTDGENLSTSGLVLTVNYDKGSSTTIKSGFTVSGYDKTKVGTQTVTVAYGGKTTTFTVVVRADYVPVKTIEYNGHIYSFYDEFSTYANAVARCKAMGGKLVSITSAEEQKMILKELEGSKRDNYWIGLSDGGNIGKFKWESGETYSYKNWISGQPNSASGENAAIMQKAYDGQWNDVSATSYTNAGFICEIDANTIKHTATKNYNGKTYYRFDTHMSWNDAKLYAEMFGGHLVTITSADEQTAVQSLASGGTADSYWLGGTDVAKSGTFKWVTGETFSYKNWLVNNPGNTNSCEHYIEMAKAHSYRWNDVKSAGRDNVATGFIVEVESFTIKLDKTDVTMLKGTTLQLTATVSGGVYKASDVVWSSKNTSVAKVSATGLVTPVSSGSTVVAAEIDGKVVYCMITVI